ncbi:hypothetical protein [Paremcibacter congregatus]|uniref:hypothetical protein n=1 Tax=Paremcibacter congregatus TaxID=2043170 RepID=UPI0030EC8D2E|tara:strand:- start:1653 stop:1844 length:192 start_codon:yes stop_codon:yes gene_type:complete
MRPDYTEYTHHRIIQLCREIAISDRDGLYYADIADFIDNVADRLEDQDELLNDANTALMQVTS